MSFVLIKLVEGIQKKNNIPFNTWFWLKVATTTIYTVSLNCFREEMSYLTLPTPQANNLISLSYFGSHSANQKPSFPLPGVLAAPFINNALSTELDVLTSSSKEISIILGKLLFSQFYKIIHRRYVCQFRPEFTCNKCKLTKDPSLPPTI